MAPTRPNQLNQCRVRLAREPVAAAEARSQVRAVIGAWQVPIDPDIAVLLTSDLVTDAIVRGDGETITLAVRCFPGRLRVDVYETSGSPPAAGGPADAPTGRGLVLVAGLSAEWGAFCTPAGRAAYFTLALQPDLPWGRDHAAYGSHVGTAGPTPPPGSPSPLTEDQGKTPDR